jgi:alkanesulfonate monooxygenase SsuD/methylene tetrahydromethanopterin reductase-like flavin-dependent oxidoreductase (luciferase family)
VDFGVIYDVTISDPSRTREQEHFDALIEQVQLAERVGFDSVWHVEHHFLKEISHSSSSDVLLAAYAAATSTIRLGYGVKLLPSGYMHPIRSAEAVATLDLISKGRVEFGTGRGFTRDEIEGFGNDPQKSRDEWQESLEMILKCWEDETFSWSSPNHVVPPRDVVPKPRQDPHPPIWMACTGPDSHRVAGELGLGLLSFTVMVPIDEVTRRIGIYREGLSNCTSPVGKFVNDRVACFSVGYCGETDEEAKEAAGASVEWYVKNMVAKAVGFAQWLDGSEIPSYEYVKIIAGFDPQYIDFDFLNSNDLCIVGDPDTCIKKLKKYEEIGIDLLLLNFQGYGIPLDKVSKSIERFGKEVIPAFR